MPAKYEPCPTCNGQDPPAPCKTCKGRGLVPIRSGDAPLVLKPQPEPPKE